MGAAREGMGPGSAERNNLFPPPGSLDELLYPGPQSQLLHPDWDSFRPWAPFI